MFKRSIHTQEVIIEQECNKRDENPLIVKVDEKLSTTATKQKIVLTSKWVEKSQYHWLFHLVFLSLVPLWIVFSWQLVRYWEYSQSIGLITFLMYPAWSFIGLPVVDTAMNLVHVHASLTQFAQFFPIVATQLNQTHWTENYTVEKDGLSRALNNRQQQQQPSIQLSLEERIQIKKQKEAFDNRYTTVLRCFAVAHTATFLYSLYQLQDLQERAPVEWYKSTVFWGQFAILGMIQAAPSSSVSHELYHRLKKVDRFFGKLLLTTMMYTHFSIEHVYGHHKNVATVHDPATARFYQTFYAFFLQSTIGGYINSWYIENEQLRSKNRNNGRRMHWKQFLLHHRILHYSVLCYMVIPLAMYLWQGYAGVVAVTFQAFMGIWFVELINYFEHYGLQREMRPDGTFEPVQEWHSWDMPEGHLSKLSYCNLVLHSDHHHSPLKHYEHLEVSKNEKTPTLPYSYAVMALMSMVPSLFFSVIHKEPVFQQEKYKKQFLRNSSA